MKLRHHISFDCAKDGCDNTFIAYRFRDGKCLEDLLCDSCTSEYRSNVRKYTRAMDKKCKGELNEDKFKELCTLIFMDFITNDQYQKGYYDKCKSKWCIRLTPATDSGTTDFCFGCERTAKDILKQAIEDGMDDDNAKAFKRQLMNMLVNEGYNAVIRSFVKSAVYVNENLLTVSNPSIIELPWRLQDEA